MVYFFTHTRLLRGGVSNVLVKFILQNNSEREYLLFSNPASLIGKGGLMHTISSQFAHIFLFACPTCSRPLVTTCNSKHRSLETADGYYFHPRCHCGWNGTVAGLEAIKHWLEPWSDEAPVGKGVVGSCDE